MSTLRKAQRPLLATLLVIGLAACAAREATETRRATAVAASSASPLYAMDDFARVRKFDAHVNANSADRALLQQATADGFELLSINVDYPAFPPVAEQHAAALALARVDPVRFHWAATFTMQGHGAPDWIERIGGALGQAVA